MLEELKKEISDLKDILDTDFEGVYDNAVSNSVGKAPVHNRKKVTLTKEGKRVVAIGLTFVTIVSSIVAFKLGIDLGEDAANTKEIVSIMDEKYSDLVLRHWKPGELVYFYDCDDIASKIASSEDLDEAIYAAWYSMDTEKETNMDEVFVRLRIKGIECPDNFDDYVKGKGYVDKDGNVDIEAYVAAQEELMLAKSVLSNGKGK